MAVLGLQAAVEIHPFQRRLHSRVSGWTGGYKVTLLKGPVDENKTRITVIPKITKVDYIAATNGKEILHYIFIQIYILYI